MICHRVNNTYNSSLMLYVDMTIIHVTCPASSPTLLPHNANAQRQSSFHLHSKHVSLALIREDTPHSRQGQHMESTWRAHGGSQCHPPRGTCRTCRVDLGGQPNLTYICIDATTHELVTERWGYVCGSAIAYLFRERQIPDIYRGLLLIVSRQAPNIYRGLLLIMSHQS